MLEPDDLPPIEAGLSDREYDQLRHELNEAHALSRGLRRQLEKALIAAQEAQRAHAKMVATLTETMRENTSLTHERDLWRTRAQRLATGHSAEPGGVPSMIDISPLADQLTPDEINAIRKAMARLHHPDVGGNHERMKAWNAALDRISQS